jgi:hypothetical protein
MFCPRNEYQIAIDWGIPHKANMELATKSREPDAE